MRVAELVLPCLHPYWRERGGRQKAGGWTQWLHKTHCLPSPLPAPPPPHAAAAAKSLQSCPTLCDPIDGSPPGSPSSILPQTGPFKFGASLHPLICWWQGINQGRAPATVCLEFKTGPSALPRNPGHHLSRPLPTLAAVFSVYENASPRGALEAGMAGAAI